MAWHPCCCCRYCANCTSGYAPFQVQVDISGIAEEAPPDCGNCATLNGSYVLTFVAGLCRWEYELEAAICGVKFIRVEAGGLIFPLGYPLVASLRDAGGGQLASVAKYFANSVPCLTLDAESLGALSEGMGDPLSCDVTGSAVLVTALRPCKAA